MQNNSIYVGSPESQNQLRVMRIYINMYIYLKNQHIIMHIETETTGSDADRNKCKTTQFFSKLSPKINAHGRGDFRSKKALG